MPEETLTLLAVTDLHGRAIEWDYLADAAPTEPGSVARIAALSRRIRRQNPACLLFDVGDTIQGDPMMALAARDALRPHPMATALNAIGVAAACVGNHELNFGLQHLHDYAADCAFPLLAANFSGLPGVGGRTLLELPVGSLGVVKVGVLGLSTPGSLVWDRPHLAGRVTAVGIVDAADAEVRALRAAGADVVVVLSHAGLGPSSTYGDALPWPENDTRRLIREVAGIDAVFLGHAHVEEVGHEIRERDGVAVPYVEPACFGRRLGRIDLRLRRTADGSIAVSGSVPRSLPVDGVAEDPQVLDALAAAHARTRAHVGRPVGTVLEPIPAWPVRRGPSPAVDLVNNVQAAAVAEARAAREAPPRRVLSATPLFGAHDGLPAGQLTIGDLVRLYPFENLLQAVELTTTELLGYLEHDALGFGRSTVPAYNVDSLGSHAHEVSYLVDPSAPPGRRISELLIDGAAPPTDELFVLALSSYRASGGGGFPATAEKPLAHDDGHEVRDLLVDWVRARGTLHPRDIRRALWRVG